MRPMDKKKQTRYFIQVFVSIAIIVLLFYQLNLSDFTQQFYQLSYSNAIWIFLLLLPSIWIRAFRWKLLFDQPQQGIAMANSIRLLMVGLAFNLILPASSGDVVKSYVGYKWSGVKERMLSVSLIDKIVAIAAVCLLGAYFSFYKGLWQYGLVACAIFVPCILFILFPTIKVQRALIVKIAEKMTSLVRNKINFIKLFNESKVEIKIIPWVILLSIVGWGLTYLQLYFCFEMTHANMDWVYIFSVAPIITVARLFPFTFSGVGSDETVMVILFKQAGASLETILASALLYRLFVIVLPGVCGLYFLFGPNRFNNNTAESI